MQCIVHVCMQARVYVCLCEVRCGISTVTTLVNALHVFSPFLHSFLLHIAVTQVESMLIIISLL